MATKSTVTKKEFLYQDENVKYSFSTDGDYITIGCDHPVFRNRFKSNSTTVSKNDFFKTSQKGSIDYDFFEKLKISLQEYFLDHGVKE